MIRRTRQDDVVRGTRLVIGADAIGRVEDRGERDHGKTDEVGAAEVGGRSGQVTAGEVGPGQYRACHLRTRPGNPAGNHGAGENGPGQGGRGRPGHEGGEVAAGEVRACAVGPRQLQAAQVQPREGRFLQVGAVQDAAAEGFDFAEVTPGQVVVAAQVAVGQVRPGEAQAGSVLADLQEVEDALPVQARCGKAGGQAEVGSPPEQRVAIDQVLAQG